MINWNELRNRAYKTACEHGWHDKDWSDEHLLCLIISELMEAVQADRKGRRADKTAFENVMEYNKEYFPKEELPFKFRIEFESRIKDSLEDELSDVCIRLFDLAGLRGIDLSTSHSIINIIQRGKTFTENIYFIIREITDFEYSLDFKINYVLSKIFALDDMLGIDLPWFIEQKMKYNELREYKHRCKY